MPNPQLDFVLNFIRENLTSVAYTGLEDMRARLDATGKLAPPLPGLRSEQVEVAGLRGEWFVPEQADEGRAVLFVHGGGFVLGSIDSHRDITGRVALASRAPTLAIEYRRAPEHPFPAAIDDVVRSYEWLTGAAGHAPGKLALVADSAGANLALAALLRARASQQLELPGALACMSAWTDLSCSAESLTTGRDPLVSAAEVATMAQTYLAGHDPAAPEASPLHADLRGLPPLLLQTGSNDAVRDDSERLARRCEEAGVDVTLEVWDDMFHAFQLWAAMLPDGQAAIAKLGEFVRRNTGA